MSLQHIQKNSPRLLPKPAKFEKNPPNGYRVIRKTKCGAGGAGRAGSSPIHKQASLAGRLITQVYMQAAYTSHILHQRCWTSTLALLVLWILFVYLQVENGYNTQGSNSPLSSRSSISSLQELTVFQCVIARISRSLKS